jgi:hypothetical protein
MNFTLANGSPGPLNREEAAVFMASLDELRGINEVAGRYGWGARWAPSLLDELADPDDAHLLVPALRNGNNPGVPTSCRCYLWLKLRSQNARALSMLDVSISDLDRLRRPSEKGLSYLVRVLLDELPLENLALRRSTDESGLAEDERPS